MAIRGDFGEGSEEVESTQGTLCRLKEYRHCRESAMKPRMLKALLVMSQGDNKEHAPGNVREGDSVVTVTAENLADLYSALGGKQIFKRRPWRLS